MAADKPSGAPCLAVLRQATDAAWDRGSTTAGEFRAYVLGAIASQLDHQPGDLTAQQFRNIIAEACAVTGIRHG